MKHEREIFVARYSHERGSLKTVQIRNDQSFCQNIHFWVVLYIELTILTFGYVERNWDEFFCEKIFYSVYFGNRVMPLSNIETSNYNLGVRIVTKSRSRGYNVCFQIVVNRLKSIDADNQIRSYSSFYLYRRPR